MPVVDDTLRAAWRCGDEIQAMMDNPSVLCFNVKEIICRHMAALVDSQSPMLSGGLLTTCVGWQLGNTHDH